MSYPPAPWRLQGECPLAVYLIETARARPFVPPELAIVPVLPGRTLAGAFLARYGPGSAVEYNELAVLAALVRFGRRRGFWISHIYVDDSASLQGGRELWGLPKEMAQFNWQGEGRRVDVRQGEHPLCSLEAGRPVWLSRQGMTLPFLSLKRPDVLRFRARTTVSALAVGCAPQGASNATTKKSSRACFMLPGPFPTARCSAANRAYHNRRWQPNQVGGGWWSS